MSIKTQKSNSRIASFVAVIAMMISLGAGLSAAQAGDEKSRETMALELIAAGALLVDVRTPKEYEAGHLDGAINIPHDQTAERLAEYGADKTRSIVVYCRSGRRSGVATKVLTENGFTAVHNGGGYEGILAAGD